MGLAHSPRIVTDGLVLALDAGNSKKSYKTDNNLLDPSTWWVGANSVTGFGFNGTLTSNTLILDTDPFGNNAVIWKAYNPDGDADGGWNSGYIDVDHTKLYRFSVWVNRKVTGTDGSFYFGTRGYNDSLSNVGVLYRSTGTNDTNPYFYYTYQPPTAEQLPEDQWVLVVGHVWPSGSGTGSDKPETGVYNTDGTKRTITTGPSYIPKDFVWNTTVTKTAHRTYLYYSENDASVIQHWAYPRIDLVDGTEPSIDDLINNRVNSLYVYDITGKNNHGTLLNGVSYASANSGYFDFDGTDDYISEASALSDSFLQGNWTISFWVNFDTVNTTSSSANDRPLLHHGSSSTRKGLHLTQRNSRIRFGLFSDDLDSTSTISTGTWYNIVFTLNNTTYAKQIYINGTLDNSHTGGGAYTGTGSNTRIGGKALTFGLYFDGKISSVTSHSRILSASEIQQNYIALKGRFGI